ncbi:Fc receptor-like protein 5 [Clarias gariepinus]|uniref:Fc receptor-like protein 5 n=1 Tax=Clarias gariepinus TaxID=13013 RepID=UPI00234D5C3B|nr:Fc receptor-like protein 5 [Clarias gariepinus]
MVTSLNGVVTSAPEPAAERPHPVLSVSPQSWVTEGDSVTLSCEVTDSSTDWTFSWYRHFTYKNSYGDIGYKEELLSDSSRGSRGSYTISPVTRNHTGVYMCRGERDRQQVQTDRSRPQPLWITGESSPVSLIINPNRTQHFTKHILSLSCEDRSNSTGRTVRRYRQSEGVSYCSRWGSFTGSTCKISSLYTSHTGVYWCESESGETSNPVNITVHERPRPVLSVSPQSWLTEGDSVTLSCKVTDSSPDWTFSWYRHVPYRDIYGHIRYKVELLSDSSRGSRGYYTISPATRNHTEVYRCSAERNEQQVQTDHSLPQPLWITGKSPPVSLIINPNRTQHFTGDSLTLSCEDQSNSTGWTVRRYTNSNSVSDCSRWGSFTGSTSTCEISSLSKYHTGVYWCESESGENSDLVNITVYGPVLSVSPQSWLTEGDSVTLNCEVTDSSTDWTFSWYREVTYRDSDGDIRYEVKLLADSKRGCGGSYTISPAARNHTGVYRCRGQRDGQRVMTDHRNS